MSVSSLYELGLVKLWIPGIGEPPRREGGLCMLAEGGIKGDMVVQLTVHTSGFAV